ncbi:MAG: alpha-L-fucosidase [Verrucomicrobiota bacterium]
MIDLKAASAVALCGALSVGVQADEAVQPYKPAWNSLYDHEEAPEWFQDAKLGIYFHWGVYSVPAFGSEWYPRWMHFEGNPMYKHHKETYGDVNEFGYHDFIPMFKAENFDAAEWVDLFEEAGARFAGPVAEHHDGFAMWDSEITPWNSMDMGPKRDITGEIAEEVKKRGMKLVTTFHHARNLQRPWLPAVDTMFTDEGRLHWNSHYPPFDFMPTTSNDPKLQMLYGNMPEGPWYEFMWKGKVIEVIDKYQPDMIWFDVWLDWIPDRIQAETYAHYLNEARKWGKDVTIVCKHLDIPREVAIEDFEKGRLDKLVDYSWLTDDTISKGSWCYTEGLKIKPVGQVFHSLIDIVSKNGVLLLNVSPKADGTIPDNQQAVLKEMGAWLKAYGESIYETRPWTVFGEGPTSFEMGKRGAHMIKENPYTPKDIRFTRTKDGKTLYVIAMGWPGEGGTVTVETLPGEMPEGMAVESVSMLGAEGEVAFEMTENAFTMTVPGTKPEGADLATVFKLSLSGGE